MGFEPCFLLFWSRVSFTINLSLLCSHNWIRKQWIFLKIILNLNFMWNYSAQGKKGRIWVDFPSFQSLKLAGTVPYATGSLGQTETWFRCWPQREPSSPSRGYLACSPLICCFPSLLTHIYRRKSLPDPIPGSELSRQTGWDHLFRSGLL